MVKQKTRTEHYVGWVSPISSLAIRVFRGEEIENIFNKNGTILFENIDFKSGTEIDIADIDKPFHFKKCRFFNQQNGRLTEVVINGNRKSNLRYEDCEVKKIRANNASNISLVNCNLTIVDLSSCTISEFQGCNFSSLRISNNSIISNTKFENLSGCDAKIDNSTVIGDFLIEKCKELKLHLDQVKINDGSLRIKNNIISDVVRLQNLECKKLSYQDNEGKLEVLESKFNELSIYRNKGELNLFTSGVNSGKITSNKKGSQFSLQSTTIHNSLSFDKNQFEYISIQNQEVKNLKFLDNSGKIIIGNPIGDVFPDLRKNSFSSLKLYLISDSDRIYNLLLDEIKQVEIDELLIRRLEVYANSIEELTIRNASVADCEYQLNLNKSNLVSIDKLDIDNLTIQKSNINRIEITGSTMKAVEILGNTINQLSFENNKSITKVWIHEATVSEASFSKAEIQELEINSPTIKSLSFSQNLKSNVKIIGEAIGLDSIEVSGQKRNQSNWFFANQSLSKLTISYCTSINNFFVYEENSKQNEDLFQLDIINCKITKAHFSQFKSNFYSIYSEYSEFNIKNTIKPRVNSRIFTSESDTIEKISFENYSSDREVTFDNLTLRERLHFKYGFIPSIKIINSEFEQTGIRNNLNEIKIENPSVRELKIEGASITSLELKSCRPQNFLLQKSSVKSLTLNDFKRPKNKNGFIGLEMSFINTDQSFKAETLAIKNSSLDDLSLNSCYFSSFRELEVYSSKLDNVYCTATTWPKKVVSYSDAKRKKQNQFEIREACRQLKLAMGDHQDRVSELQFHALEMNAYRKITLSGKGTFWRFNDIVSLFGGWTNRFGLSWTRPLLLAFLSISAIYIRILYLHYDLSSFASIYSCINLEDYFQLYNPTHRMSQLNLKGNISGSVAALDFFSKIVSAFFIYQIAAAFRKYRK